MFYTGYSIMTILTSSTILTTVYVILAFKLHGSDVFGVIIKVKVFDSLGRDSSLLYDGGIVDITCELQRNGTGRIGALELHIANDTGVNFTRLVTRNGTMAEHRVRINSESLNKVYKCVTEKDESETVQISYALCHQRSVKPRRICPNPHEFCQITKARSTTCKPLDKISCWYGNENFTADLNQSPTFRYVCGDNGAVESEYGLCYSLTLQNITRPRFVADSPNVCKGNLGVYVSNNGRQNRKKLEMAGWNYIDLNKSDSIYASFQSTYLPALNVVCNVTYVEHTEITSKTMAPSKDTPNLPNDILFVDQLNLTTPAMAYILCTGNVNVIQLQTTLLLFRSGKDLLYNISEVIFNHSSGRLRYTAWVEIVPQHGLYVCANGSETNCGGDTRPTYMAYMKIEAPYEGARSRTTKFYAELFASAPTKKYVRIYKIAVRFTFPLPAPKDTTTTPGLGSGMGCTPASGAGTWQIRFNVGVLVVIIVLIIRSCRS